MWIGLFVILLATQSSGFKYKFIPDNYYIFDGCPNQRENVLNISAMFDSSNLSLASNDDIISVSGSVTYIWNIQRGDRILVTFQ